MTQVVDLNTDSVGPSFPQFAFGRFAAALGLPDEPYTIRVVNKAGGLLAALSSADPADPNQAWPEEVLETINAPISFGVTFPKHAFSKADVDILGNSTHSMEIQVLLGDQVIAWGPAISESGGSDSESVTLQCFGPDWYFGAGKRAIDQEAENLLSYGGFEAGDFTGWRTSGTFGGGPVGSINIDPEIETDLVFQGTYALRLTAFGAVTSGLAVVSNPVNFTAGPLGNVLALTFSACVDIVAEAALFKAGVILVAGPPGSDGAPQGGVNAKWSRVWRLDETTPTDVELRQSLQVRIPPNQTWAVQVLVFSPKSGVVVYDHFFLAPHRKLDTQSFTGSPTATVDVSRIARMIFDHTLSDIHHHNKSDLFIGLSVPSCGVRQARKYEFVDHIPVDQAFGEFLDRDDCFEYWVDFTATTRTLRLEPIDPAFNPRGQSGLGTDYGTDVVLTYPNVAGGPVAGYSTNIDGGSVVNQVVALGGGDGLTREEAWDEDATLIGGTTLQGVVNAPTDAPYNSLLPLARGTRTALDEAAVVIEVTVTRDPGGYIPDSTVILADFLKLGDRLTLAITDGWHTYTGLWRIVRRIRHCRARTMTYTLNKVAA